MKKYQMLIGGEWKDASDRKTFLSYNPSTGEPWAEIAEASEEDVNLAVETAYRIYETEWSQMTPTARGHALRRLADLLVENSEELGRVESLDTGKLLLETRWQAKYIAEYFYFYAGCADKISGETLPIDKPDLFVFTDREPLGVVAAVVPWNSQLFLSAVKIGPALAAGNTIVLKTSEHASAAMLEFGKLIKEAKIPDGVINIISGHGDPCGRTLTSHPLVSRISFTGGPQAARHVLQNSTNNFAQVSLELGGKSPFIVFDDADLDSAVNGSVSGIFAASGQSCVAGSRLYLQEKIADEFLEKMKTVVKTIKIGDPNKEDTQMGPLCTQAQRDNIEKEVSKAVEEGGKILAGGKQPDPDAVGGLNGWFYEPTIIECPNNQLKIVDTELFGPVLSVVRFKEEDEVVKMANQTKHGLAAGIFTRDSARSIRIAKAVRAGIVWVNTYRVISPVAEFGGYRNSGYGRESGFQAMYDYTRSKTVWMNTSNEPLANQFVPR